MLVKRQTQRIAENSAAYNAALDVVASRIESLQLLLNELRLEVPDNIGMDEIEDARRLVYSLDAVLEAHSDFDPSIQ